MIDTRDQILNQLRAGEDGRGIRFSAEFSMRRAEVQRIVAECPGSRVRDTPESGAGMESPR